MILGGFVVLEALSYGLPVICLNIGGPGVVVTSECGISIDTERKVVEQIIKDIYLRYAAVCSGFTEKYIAP